jgi:hypothetical protein
MSDHDENGADESGGEFVIDREALVQAFVAESAEVLASMEELLLRLEASPEDPETIHSLFRAAHTLKGSSSLVAFDEVRDLSDLGTCWWVIERCARAATVSLLPRRGSPRAVSRPLPANAPETSPP